MKDWFNIAAMVIVGILAMIVIVLFSGVFIALLGLMLLFFIVVWALGLPITVSVKGKKVGYIKWTKFYPMHRPLDRSDG